MSLLSSRQSICHIGTIQSFFGCLIPSLIGWCPCQPGVWYLKRWAPFKGRSWSDTKRAHTLAASAMAAPALLPFRLAIIRVCYLYINIYINGPNKHLFTPRCQFKSFEKKDKPLLFFSPSGSTRYSSLATLLLEKCIYTCGLW